MEFLNTAEISTMKNRNCRIERSFVTTLAGFILILMSATANASPVPSVLPRPDGKPGDVSKPVKVYILAGQSNMVGMGEISGAKCRYAGIYLTPDPAAPLGPFAIWRAGEYKILPLKVYGPDGTKADKPIAEGFLEVPEAGVYRIQCDCSETPYATVILEGREVYAFTRPGDEDGQKFARGLGAVWAGGSDELPPELLDAAIIFAPVGELLPAALRAVAAGEVSRHGFAQEMH